MEDLLKYAADATIMIIIKMCVWRRPCFFEFFNGKDFPRFCHLQAINACGRAGKWTAGLALLEELRSQRLADATSVARSRPAPIFQCGSLPPYGEIW